MTEDSEYAVALALCPTLERRSFNHLVHRLGTAKAVWEASTEKWLGHCNLHKNTVFALDKWRRQASPEALLRSLWTQEIVAVVRGDELYPKVFEQWGEDAPTVLFGRGRIDLLTATPSVSVVGTRRASAYGLEVARWVAGTVARAGCTVVSGLALGIDGSAQRATLDAGGSTIAILGCGVNLCYPPSHRDIYQRLLKRGLVISEYPPDTPVARHHFPERNRLIAALGQVLIIVQAGEQSGALGTVDASLTLGRDVYVVPGPITSKLFRGSNRLLKDGAQILLDPVDLLADLGLQGGRTREQRPGRWGDIYDALETPQSASALCILMRRPQDSVYTALMELELDGWIVRLPGGVYRRCR